MGAVYLAVVVVLVASCTEACGPQKFEPVSVLETDPRGHVVMNVTAVVNVSWTMELRSSVDIPRDTPQYFWANSALAISTDTTAGLHFFTLTTTLDLEFAYKRWGLKITALEYTLMCQTHRNPQTSFVFFLIVTPVNEFVPEFVGAPFDIWVPENTPLDTVVMKLRDNATDGDVSTSSSSDIHEFNMVEVPVFGTNLPDLFSMDDKQNGQIQVKQELDFESEDFAHGDAVVVYNITVWDLGRLNSTSTLTIHILDTDDQPPEFYYPGCSPTPCYVFYTCEVSYDFTGVVTNMKPANITAREGDTLGHAVKYRFKAGPQFPRYSSFVSIDEDTGMFSVLQPLAATGFTEVALVLQAYEVSERELSRDATVILKVTYPDGYITTTPNAGTSREGTGSSEAIVVAVVVLAVFVLVAFLALGALIVYMKKRSDKPIYPAEMFEEGEEEGEQEGGTTLQRGGSNTDSGQWSMTGVPSPGHHPSSTAPTHTRLPADHQPNGHLVNGHVVNGHVVNGQVPGQFRRTAKGSARGARRSASAQSSEVSIGETSRLSIGDIHPQEDSQAEDDTYHNGVVHHETMSMQRASAYPHSGGGALVHAQMHGSGHVGAQRGNGVLHEEDETESAEGGGEGPSGSTQSRRLPPLSAPPGPRSAAPDDNTKPLPRRARTSRKQRREQALARLRAEVFDGTKSYPMSSDVAFYTEGKKQRVKRSTRKRNNGGITLDPKFWMTVENDYTEL